jgi:hypothetical protein
VCVTGISRDPRSFVSGVTTVLTMTTMGFSGRAQMPRVSYATALDSFVIICFSFVFAVMIEYAAINFFDKIAGDIKKLLQERGVKKKVREWLQNYSTLFTFLCSFLFLLTSSLISFLLLCFLFLLIFSLSASIFFLLFLLHLFLSFLLYSFCPFSFFIPYSAQFSYAYFTPDSAPMFCIYRLS